MKWEKAEGECLIIGHYSYAMSTLGSDVF